MFKSKKLQYLLLLSNIYTGRGAESAGTNQSNGHGTQPLGRLRRHRSGFVLLLTLALIAIAGLLLTGIARRSLIVAIDVLAQEEDLQRRWGSYSCQAALLRHADSLLVELARSSMKASDDSLDSYKEAALEDVVPEPSRVSIIVHLGEVSFNLLLADEEAKANINSILSTKPSREEAAQVIRKLVLNHSTLSFALPVESKIKGKEVANFSLRQPDSSLQLQSWGEVFAFNQLTSGLVTAELRAATSDITCWGSGRLNIRRASDETLEEVCRLVLDARSARRLRELRSAHPKARVGDLTRALSLGESRRQKLEALLNDSSQCYSLWIQTNSVDNTTFQLCLAHQEPSGKWRTELFHW